MFKLKGYKVGTGEKLFPRKKSWCIINFKEISLYQFASSTKPLHTLTHWNFCFTIVNFALKYVYHMGECSSTIAKFVVSTMLFVSIINDQ